MTARGRRQHEEAIRAQQSQLRESEASYRQQFAANSAVMMLVDPSDGTIVDANAAATVFYGYPRERLKAMKITDISSRSASAIQDVVACISQAHGQRVQWSYRQMLCMKA
jgi:PAS domain S-box-containing protein